jgi:hypothetical protein
MKLVHLSLTNSSGNICIHTLWRGAVVNALVLETEDPGSDTASVYIGFKVTEIKISLAELNCDFVTTYRLPV